MRICTVLAVVVLVLVSSSGYAALGPPTHPHEPSTPPSLAPHRLEAGTPHRGDAVHPRPSSFAGSDLRPYRPPRSQVSGDIFPYSPPPPPRHPPAPPVPPRRAAPASGSSNASNATHWYEVTVYNTDPSAGIFYIDGAPVTGPEWSSGPVYYNNTSVQYYSFTLQEATESVYYRFLGWYGSFYSTSSFIADTVGSNTTVYLEWERLYTVTVLAIMPPYSGFSYTLPFWFNGTYYPLAITGPLNQSYLLPLPYYPNGTYNVSVGKIPFGYYTAYAPSPVTIRGSNITVPVYFNITPLSFYFYVVMEDPLESSQPWQHYVGWNNLSMPPFLDVTPAFVYSASDGYNYSPSQGYAYGSPWYSVVFVELRLYGYNYSASGLRSYFVYNITGILSNASLNYTGYPFLSMGPINFSSSPAANNTGQQSVYESLYIPPGSVITNASAVLLNAGDNLSVYYSVLRHVPSGLASYEKSPQSGVIPNILYYYYNVYLHSPSGSYISYDDLLDMYVSNMTDVGTSYSPSALSGSIGALSSFNITSPPGQPDFLTMAYGWSNMSSAVNGTVSFDALVPFGDMVGDPNYLIDLLSTGITGSAFNLSGVSGDYAALSLYNDSFDLSQLLGAYNFTSNMTAKNLTFADFQPFDLGYAARVGWGWNQQYVVPELVPSVSVYPSEARFSYGGTSYLYYNFSGVVDVPTGLYLQGNFTSVNVTLSIGVRGHTTPYHHVTRNYFLAYISQYSFTTSSDYVNITGYLLDALGVTSASPSFISHNIYFINVSVSLSSLVPAVRYYYGLYFSGPSAYHAPYGSVGPHRPFLNYNGTAYSPQHFENSTGTFRYVENPSIGIVYTRAQGVVMEDYAMSFTSQVPIYPYLTNATVYSSVSGGLAQAMGYRGDAAEVPNAYLSSYIYYEPGPLTTGVTGSMGGLPFGDIQFALSYADYPYMMPVVYAISAPNSTFNPVFPFDYYNISYDISGLIYPPGYPAFPARENVATVLSDASFTADVWVVDISLNYSYTTASGPVGETSPYSYWSDFFFNSTFPGFSKPLNISSFANPPYLQHYRTLLKLITTDDLKYGLLMPPANVTENQSGIEYHVRVYPGYGRYQGIAFVLVPRDNVTRIDVVQNAEINFTTTYSNGSLTYSVFNQSLASFIYSVENSSVSSAYYGGLITVYIHSMNVSGYLMPNGTFRVIYSSSVPVNGTYREVNFTLYYEGIAAVRESFYSGVPFLYDALVYPGSFVPHGRTAPYDIWEYFGILILAVLGGYLVFTGIMWWLGAGKEERIGEAKEYFSFTKK